MCSVGTKMATGQCALQEACVRPNIGCMHKSAGPKGEDGVEYFYRALIPTLCTLLKERRNAKPSGLT